MDINRIIEESKYGKVDILPSLSSNTWQNTAVVVVGCGGTGSRLIPLIAQHISNANRTIQENPRHTEYIKHKIDLILCDCDQGVEQKNLLRQNFIRTDIGKRKEIVFAERMSAIYGLDVKYISDKISKENLSDFTRSVSNIIFFDCTDNLTARKSIEEIYNAYSKNCIIISGGNEDVFGQVLIACKNYNHKISETIKYIYRLNNAIKNPNKEYKETFNFLPTLTSLYPNIKEEVKVSCAEMVLQNEQSMPINNLVATLMYNVFYNIVSGKSLNYNLVRCNINNTFTTNNITNPKTLLNLYCKSLTGLDNSFHIIDEHNTISTGVMTNNTLKNNIIDFANKYGTATINLLDNFISSYGYRLYGNDYTDIANIIANLKEERDGNI